MFREIRARRNAWCLSTASDAEHRRRNRILETLVAAAIIKKIDHADTHQPPAGVDGI